MIFYCSWNADATITTERITKAAIDKMKSLYNNKNDVYVGINSSYSHSGYTSFKIYLTGVNNAVVRIYDSDYKIQFLRAEQVESALTDITSTVKVLVYYR